MNSEIHIATSQRVDAELQRPKLLIPDIQLSKVRPAAYYIQRAKAVTVDSERKRKESSLSSMKVRRTLSPTTTLSQKSLSVLRHRRSKTREETVIPLTTEESLARSFPEWLLNDREFLNLVAQPTTTIQARVAETCRKLWKRRTVKENEELLCYITSLEFFKPIPNGLVRRAIDKMITVTCAAGEACN